MHAFLIFMFLGHPSFNIHNSKHNTLFHDKEQRPKKNFLNTFLSCFRFNFFFCILFFDSWNLIMDKFYKRRNNKSCSFFLVFSVFLLKPFFSPSCTVRCVLSDTRKLDFLSFLPNFLHFPSGATLQPPKSENSC